MNIFMIILKTVFLIILFGLGVFGIYLVWYGIKMFSDVRNHRLYVVEGSIQMHIGMGIFILILAILGGRCVGNIEIKDVSYSSSSYSSDGELRCKSCGRSFSDDNNVRSIKHTNMCENCYNNYKFGSEAKEAEKDYKGDN